MRIDRPRRLLPAPAGSPRSALGPPTGCCSIASRRGCTRPACARRSSAIWPLALDTPLPALLGDLVSLARRGHLVQVAKNRFFLPATVHALADVATDLARSAGATGFDAATYRDRSGLGRNLTIEVLEHLDRTGVTRFRDGRRRMTEPAPVIT